MFHLNPGLGVFVHREPVDFRKSINGLCALVEHDLVLDPFAHAVYVFTNRSHNRIKILGWSGNGFWLLQKRLERERFIWPMAREQRVIELSVQQLHWLLDGLDALGLRAHAKLHYQRAA